MERARNDSAWFPGLLFPAQANKQRSNETLDADFTLP